MPLEDNMIRYFSTHPTASNLVMLLFLVLGVWALPELKRETFPTFTSSQVQVKVKYPGATAEEVEEAIVQRLEEAVKSVENVKRSTARASEGVGILNLEMEDGAGEISKFLDDIRTEVESIGNFPNSAEDPVITIVSRSSQVVSIAITGPMTITDLKDYSETIKRKLLRLPEVSQVSLSGFSDRQIHIQVSTDILLKYGLTINEISNKINNQSVNRPIGSVDSSNKEYLLRFKDERRTPEEYRNIIVIGGAKGAEIKLGDIAKIEERFEDEEIKTLFNNQRAGIISVSKTESEDALIVVDAVKQFVEKEQLKAPTGIKLDLTQDMASVIGYRLSLLVSSGWQGLLLVFFSLWLFFNLRLSFWVSMGLPVSFAGAIFVMQLIGFSLNTMTMIALIITLGLLMDDAIVIAENIATHLQKGKSALNATVDGVMEVRIGIISSFLTTACVFIPLAFLEGQMGKVLKVIPVVLLAVLVVSLVEAFFILPNHLSHALARQKMAKVGKFREAFNRGIEWVRNALLGKAVDLAVTYRYLTVGIVIMVFVGSLGTFRAGWLKFSAFPKAEDDSMEARIYLPPGTLLLHTEGIVDRVIKGLNKTNEVFKPLQPEKQDLVQNVRVAFAHNADVGESGPHLATVYVDLLGNKVRRGRLDDVLDAWRQNTGKITDVISLKFTQPSKGPAGNAIEVELRGDDLEELNQIARKIEKWLYQFDGVYDLYTDLRPGKPEIQLKLKPGATALGLDANTIANQLGAAFRGTTAAEIQVGIKEYEINVSLEPESKDSLSDLDQFKIISGKGEQIPLKSIVISEASRGYSTINHVDGVRTVTLYGSLNSRVANSSEIMNRLKKQFLPDIKAQYPDLEIVLGGESKNSSETGASMIVAMVTGLLGIYILLSFQFKSYIEPVVVMLAIPFSLIGVIWGHLAMGLPLSMPSLLGYISLTGIVVNDSILLVEFIKNRRREGKSVTESTRLASRERFRAVLLTSVTTVVGLIPLLAETSPQAKNLVPIAASISFGIIASTILVLIAIPSFYSILGDFGLLRDVEVLEPE